MLQMLSAPPCYQRELSKKMPDKFEELLKKYRNSAINPDSNRPLSQAKLADLIHKRDSRFGFEPSVVSRWESGERLSNFQDRNLLLALIYVLKENAGVNGLQQLEQANLMLAALGARDLETDEATVIDLDWARATSKQPIQPDDDPEIIEQFKPAEEGQIYEAPGQNFGRWTAEWVENLFQFSAADEHMRSSYSGYSIYTLERIVNSIIGGNFALIITIFALWIFTNQLMFPMWSWQLGDPTVRFYAMVRFGIGSVTIPLLIAFLTKQETGRELNTDTWRNRAKVFYLKYTGAITAFNVFAVGYFIFPVLPLSFSKAFSGLLTNPFTWILLSLPPIFFSHVTAQRIPTDRLKMKGEEPHVLDGDMIFGSVFTFFGPGIAYLLYQNYEGFLDPFTGVAVLLFFINIYIWQQRQDKDNPRKLILTVLQFGFFLPFVAALSYVIINLQELEFSETAIDLSAESVLSTMLVVSYGILLIAMYVITLQKNPPQVNFAGTVGLVILMALVAILLRIAPYWGALTFITPFVIYPPLHRWFRPWFWVHPAFVLAFLLVFVSLALGLRELVPLWANLTGFWFCSIGLMWWAFQPAYPTEDESAV